MATFPQITSPPQASAEVVVNEALETMEHQAVYGKNHATTTGLTWGYYGGRWGGFSISAGTFTLTNTSANYIVVAIATGVSTASTSATNWNNSTDYARVYKATTAGGVVTALEDHRAGPGGVSYGGGAGGGGDALVADPLSQFAATTSAQLASVISDETGSGALVFASAPTLVNPVVGTQSGGDSSTKAASTAFVAAAITSGLASSDVMVYKGATDCSANPNYPAADAGAVYIVSVAGKIGGASGVTVEAGDLFVCKTDSSAGGTQASVGADWDVVQTNIVGAALTSGTLAQFASTTSAQLATLLSDETGTGLAVFNDSPALAGNPTAPTQTAGNNTTRIATTAFVTSAAAAAAVADGDKGDITVSASGATWTVDNDVVTYAKMQNVSATSRVIARKTAGSGDPEEATLSEILDFIGSAAQGDILYRGASTWARLVAGTLGYLLRTGGSGANPAWFGGVATLTDAATVAVDASLADNFRVVLGGNRTLGNPSNLVSGQVLNFRIHQDGTGTRTLAYSSKYKFAGGSAPVLSTAAGAKDFMSCQYDATDDTLYCSTLKAFA